MRWSKWANWRGRPSLLLLKVLILQCALFSVAAYGADAMTRLQFMEGQWQTQRYLPDVTQKWVPAGKAAVTFSSLFSGRYIQGEVELEELEYRMIFGHDPWQQRYRMVAMNNDNGQLSVFDGSYHSGRGLVLDNAASGTWFEQEGKRYYLRYEISPSENDGMVMDIFRAESHTMEWQAVSRVVFSKYKNR